MRLFRFGAGLILLGGATSGVGAQRAVSVGAMPPVVSLTPALGAAIDSVFRLEDARPRSADSLAALRAFLKHPEPRIRAFAARALGRQERADQIDALAGALADANPAVRIDAADALPQAAARGGAPANVAARRALLARIPSETDEAVRAMIAESIGRLANASWPADSTAAAIRSLVGPRPTRRLLHGVARGLYFAAIKQAPGSPTAVPFLASLTTSMAGADSGAFIVEMALSSLVAMRQMTPAALDAGMSHPRASVRERAVAGLNAFADTVRARSAVTRALSDPAPLVRFRAVQIFNTRFRASDGCVPLVTASRDTAATVALAAIDAMARCTDEPSIAALEGIANALPAGDGAAWHRAAHATVALTASAPRRAGAPARALSSHANELARTYAAQAAHRLGDTATLLRLARDLRPNVVAAAIDGLGARQAGATPAGLLRHAADSLYVRALGIDDNQVLMRATAALAGSVDATVVPALFSALDRLTRVRKETTRDGRVALVERIGELGKPSDSTRLAPYLADFDGSVVERAVAIMGRWTGRPVIGAARSLAPVPVPPASELLRMARMRALLEMEDGSNIELSFYPFDAPTNVARFVRLAREGKFDGLTFHRVAPYFVVQGLSPNANEYSAPDGPFTRDELGMDNLRQTVGLSTRGRDTGDGQIYFNLVHNIRLDHDYTVFAWVESGWPAVERMQEGARIRRVTFIR